MNGRLFVSVLITMAAVACGPNDDNNEPRNIMTDPSNTTNNANNTNSGTNNTTAPINNGFGPECAGVECPDGRRCVRGVCVMADLGVACETPESLGELTSGMVVAGTADNNGLVDGVSTTCATELGGLSGAEYVFSLSVPAHGDVEFRIVGTDSSFEWAMEVRQDCAEAEEGPQNNPMGEEFFVSLCDVGPRLSFPGEAGEEYFVVVEPNNSIDFGSFDWEVEFTEAESECTPGRVCQGDDVLVCSGDQEFTAVCGTGCANDACLGDSCETAIEVTAAMSFSGDVGAFSNTLDFANTADCNEDPMDTGGTETPGEELILSLPGLTAGQTVIVDTSMMNENANDVFILDSCSTNATCLAVDSIDYLEWTVVADGDYFVVIDKSRALQNEPFNYAIDIQ